MPRKRPWYKAHRDEGYASGAIFDWARILTAKVFLVAIKSLIFAALIGAMRAAAVFVFFDKPLQVVFIE